MEPNMKTDKLKEYVSIRNELEKERQALEARLVQISAVLGGNGSAAASSQPASAQKGPKTMSAATRAKLAASLRKRWAQRKRLAKMGAGSAAVPAAPPGRKKMGAAARAILSAKAKARWAKAKAAGRKSL